MRVPALLVLAIALCSAPAALACQNAGRYGDDCPPYQVCSVYAGDCGSCGHLTVCCGCCQSGRVWRYVPKVGVFSASAGDPVGGVFGLEVVPPVLDGYLGLQAEWWTEQLWRFGPVMNIPATDWLLPGLSIDAAVLPGEDGAALALGGAIRAEFFPFGSCPVSFLSQISVLMEGGAQLFMNGDDACSFFGTFSLRFWI